MQPGAASALRANSILYRPFLDALQAVWRFTPQHQAFFPLKIQPQSGQARDKREVQFFPLIARLKCGKAFGRYRGYRFIKDGIAQVVIMNKDRRINEACCFADIQA